MSLTSATVRIRPGRSYSAGLDELLELVEECGPISAERLCMRVYRTHSAWETGGGHHLISTMNMRVGRMKANGYLKVRNGGYMITRKGQMRRAELRALFLRGRNGKNR